MIDSDTEALSDALALSDSETDSLADSLGVKDSAAGVIPTTDAATSRESLDVPEAWAADPDCDAVPDPTCEAESLLEPDAATGPSADVVMLRGAASLPAFDAAEVLDAVESVVEVLAECNADTAALAEALADADVDSDAEALADCEADTDVDCDAEALVETLADCEADTDVDCDAEALVESPVDAALPGARTALPSVASVVRFAAVMSKETGVMSDIVHPRIWCNRRSMRQWLVSPTRLNSISSRSASAMGSPRPPSASSPGISLFRLGVNVWPLSSSSASISSARTRIVNFQRT